MPVDLRETRLPGVGVKYAFRTADGGAARRSSCTTTASARSTTSRTTTTTSRRPSSSSRTTRRDSSGRSSAARTSGRGSSRSSRWRSASCTSSGSPCPDTSPAIGLSLADAKLRARTGVTVIAILREPEPVSGAQPEDVIQRGDTLVAVGKAGSSRSSGGSSPRGRSIHRRPSAGRERARPARARRSPGGRRRRRRGGRARPSAISRPAEVRDEVVGRVEHSGIARAADPLASCSSGRGPRRGTVPPGASAAVAFASTARRSTAGSWR